MAVIAVYLEISFFDNFFKTMKSLHICKIIWDTFLLIFARSNGTSLGLKARFNIVIYLAVWRIPETPLHLTKTRFLQFISYYTKQFLFLRGHKQKYNKNFPKN